MGVEGSEERGQFADTSFEQHPSDLGHIVSLGSGVRWAVEWVTLPAWERREVLKILGKIEVSLQITNVINLM